MKITIDTAYRAGNSTEVEMPKEKTWKDVALWHVKWGILYVTFKDGQTFEKELNDGVEYYDMKRPTDATVYDEDGNELAEL